MVDDELVICEGLRQILIEKGAPSWNVLRFYTDSEEALETCDWDGVDVLLLDINMPGISGLDLVGALRERGYETEVIIISGYSEFEYARQAMRNNVIDFIVKPVVPHKLLEAMWRAQQSVQHRLERRESQWFIQTNRRGLIHAFLGEVLFETRSSSDSAISHMVSLLSLEDIRFSLTVLLSSMDPVKLNTTVEVCNGELSSSEVHLYLSASNVVTILSLWREGEYGMAGKIESFLAHCGCTVCLEPLVTEDLLSLSRFHDLLLKRLHEEGRVPKALAGTVSEVLPNFYDKRFSLPVAQVLDCIKSDYDKPLSLAILSERVHVHPTYLSNLFSRETDYNLIDYINRFRIEKAKTYLSDPLSKIFWVAERVGFVNQRYFSQVFKRLVGVTPVQYRSDCFLTTGAR